MESKTWKEALDNHLFEFTERLPNVIDEIIRRMKSHISNEEYHKMKSVTNPMERIETLVNAISTRTIKDFTAFCKALVAVKQNDLADKLSKSQRIILPYNCVILSYRKIFRK